jgi:DNA-directed RNA polymerase specialized sigma24 family protein
MLQSAFHRRHVEHVSTREAADVSSVKISAMKSRTARARRQLAELLVGQV